MSIRRSAALRRSLNNRADMWRCDFPGMLPLAPGPTYHSLGVYMRPKKKTVINENVENPIFEQLRLIRSAVASVKLELSDLKLRKGSVEERLTLVERGVVNIYGDMVAVHNPLDHLGGRVDTD